MHSMNVENMAAMALDMLRTVENFNKVRGSSFKIRIGLNCGPVVAGVILPLAVPLAIFAALGILAWGLWPHRPVASNSPTSRLSIRHWPLATILFLFGLIGPCLLAMIVAGGLSAVRWSN